MTLLVSLLLYIPTVMLMMFCGWWGCEALHMPLPWCENRFYLSDTSLVGFLLTVWGDSQEYAYNSQSLFFFFPLIFTALFAHTSQIAGLTLTAASEIPVRQYTQSYSVNSLSYLAVKMLNNWETIPVISAFPFSWSISSVVVVFPAPGAWAERQTSGWQHTGKYG